MISAFELDEQTRNQSRVKKKSARDHGANWDRCYYSRGLLELADVVASDYDNRQSQGPAELRIRIFARGESGQHSFPSGGRKGRYHWVRLTC